MGTPATPVVPIEELPPPVSAEDAEKTRLKAALQKAEGENRRLTEQMTRRPAPMAAAPAGPLPDPDKLKVEFFKDPVNSTITIARMAAAEAAAATNAGSFDTLVTVARSTARGEVDTELWDKYSSEIDALVAHDTPDGSQYRTNSTVWKNAYFQIIGRHAREIAAKPPAGEGEGAPPIAGDGPRTPSPKRPPAPKGPTLNDDQKAFCKLWGITEDAFIHGQQLKANEGDGTPGTPSSWDEAVTVDSKRQKRFLKPFDTERKWPHNTKNR